MHDPDREAEVLVIRDALQDAVSDAQVLVAHPLEPEVGVAGAQLARPGEGGVGEPSIGERGEGRIHPVLHHGSNLAARQAGA